jgi:hypothetical protein
MSIMERLSMEIPKRRSISSINPLYNVVAKCMDEIDTAKEQGYTWCQISRALEQEAISQGIHVNEEKPNNIDLIYKKIKREATA